MKNRFEIRLTIIAIVALFSSACSSDMLDLAPYDAVSSGNVWTKSSLAEQVVTGVYEQLPREQELLNWDAFSSVLDPATGSSLAQYQMLMGGVTANTTFFETYWKAFYEGIARSNDVINNIHKVPDMTAGKKARYVAECKFIRAYYYYKLNALWRGVPVYLENVDVKDCTKGRSSADDVWNIIIQDLTDCINEQNLPAKYEANSPLYGRITKGAAYTLRGKVYLWQKNWNAAQKDFEEVGQSGYDLYLGNYAGLFTEANEHCNEMIFSIQMIEQSGYGSSRAREYGNALTTGNGYNSFFLNTRFVDSYENADGQPFDWDDYFPGYSSMEAKARSVFFLRDGMTAKEKNTMATYGADMSLYLSSGNEARLAAAYANRDSRLSATAITPYSTYLGGMTGADNLYTYRWPYKGYDSRDPFDFRIAFSNNFMVYPIRKFVPRGSENNFPTYNPIDISIFRYADVLLGLAEALNEQNETDLAIVEINKVRARAGVAALQTSDASQPTFVADNNNLRQRIQHEKLVELACEEAVYFDELRWETWKSSKFAAGNGLSEVWGAPVYQYNWLGDQCLLWPVPAAEREKNRNLEQNPLWN
ncbi:hypothetical protein FACS189413_01790 [Bacteroidia bacterium]|nr:hypothetical protein FACS189413_01790 [Bacteroidia bacterium]